MDEILRFGGMKLMIRTRREICIIHFPPLSKGSMGGGGGVWRVSSKGTYNWTGKKASKGLLRLAVLIQICFVFNVSFKASKCHFNKSILISKRWVF